MRRLGQTVQLTISGCLGPCDLSNVVSIASAAGVVWLGSLRDTRSYMTLLEWAWATGGAGRVLPLPDALDALRFNPFRPGDCLLAPA
jgi:cobaltochelatase CobN